jgi:hypothetical protein
MKKAIDKCMLSNIEKQFDELMKTDKEIMRDGIINFEKYSNSRLRVLWVLKQNIHYGYYDYAEYLTTEVKSVSGSPTWRRLAHVSYGLISGERDFDRVRELENEQLLESLFESAIIEVNKELGESRSPDSVILEGFEKYKSLVFDQITACDPDVIIIPMVGSGEALKPIVEEIYQYLTNKEYNNEQDFNTNICIEGADVAWTPVGNKTFLWTYHPSYIKEISDENYFDALVTAYDKAKETGGTL